MRYLKLEKNINYVLEKESAIILDFTNGEFYLLNGLYAKIIDLVGNNIYKNELALKLPDYDSNEISIAIDELVKNGIIKTEGQN